MANGIPKGIWPGCISRLDVGSSLSHGNAPIHNSDCPNYLLNEKLFLFGWGGTNEHVDFFAIFQIFQNFGGFAENFLHLLSETMSMFFSRPKAFFGKNFLRKPILFIHINNHPLAMVCSTHWWTCRRQPSHRGVAAQSCGTDSKWWHL